MIHIKSEKEIQLMREAANILKKVLKAVENEVKPGVTTNYLNDIAERVIKENGAKASFKGVECPYRGGKTYCHALCLSVNDEIIHGIPSDRILQEGDIVCVDLGVYKNGFHSDAGRTFGVGKISKKAQDLINVAKDAFFEAVNYAKEGCRVGDISNAVETYVTKKGYTLLEEYQGHGIGREMHEDPPIPNYGEPGRGPILKEGMTLAIEPMVLQGKKECYMLNDGWTTKTCDGKLACHHENTIVVTKEGYEILTKL